MGRLYDMRGYLSGPMDRVPDGGVQWREKVGEDLEQRGVVVLNPCDKPIDIGLEDFKVRADITRWKDEGEYDEIYERRVIRHVDLRMVDIADFLYVRWDMDVQMCGTQEEVFLANRQKKPIIIVCPQGKKNMPNWLFWTLPHALFFQTDEEAMAYLHHIDDAPIDEINHLKRWMFFKLKTPLRRKLEAKVVSLMRELEEHGEFFSLGEDIRAYSDDDLLEMYEHFVEERHGTKT